LHSSTLTIPLHYRSTRTNPDLRSDFSGSYKNKILCKW